MPVATRITTIEAVAETNRRSASELAPISRKNLPRKRAGADSGVGTATTLAQLGGVEEVTLTAPEMPSHSHALVAAATAAQATAEPSGSLPAIASTALYSVRISGTLAMDPTAVGSSGISQPHGNPP